ncbi:hypothetical protein ACWKSP_07260 [Micromonosporaceae bacterium Da 78-11]
MLDALLKAHPDLVGEVERLAAGILDDTTWESVREDVTYALLSLPLEALNERAGYQPGRGYTHECDAAGEIVEETLVPFLDDVRAAAETGHDCIRTPGRRRRARRTARLRRRP